MPNWVNERAYAQVFALIYARVWIPAYNKASARLCGRKVVGVPLAWVMGQVEDRVRGKVRRMMHAQMASQPKPATPRYGS